MKELIRQRALQLGFDDCRFSTARPPSSAGQFKDWLTQQQHGEMNYLEQNAHKRVDPQKVLQGARTIITLGVSYAPDDRGSRVEHRTGESAHNPDTQYAIRN